MFRLSDTDMEHVRPEIRTLAERGHVTWEEYGQLRMNTYERLYLYPALTDEALCRTVEEHFLPNCEHSRRAVPTTYDQTLVECLVPLLLERIRQNGHATE